MIKKIKTETSYGLVQVF